MTHYVKSWKHQFAAVVGGFKKAELRVNDRDYKVGDCMVLQEYEPGTGYTGNWVLVEITHILDKDNVCAVSKKALSDDYAIISIKLLDTGREPKMPPGAVTN